MVALLNYVKKRRCTIAGITVLEIQRAVLEIQRDGITSKGSSHNMYLCTIFWFQKQLFQNITKLFQQSLRF